MVSGFADGHEPSTYELSPKLRGTIDMYELIPGTDDSENMKRSESEHAHPHCIAYGAYYGFSSMAIALRALTMPPGLLNEIGL